MACMSPEVSRVLVNPVPFHDGYTAALPLGGHQGNTRPAQGFHVPLDGAPGYLEGSGQLRRGNPLLLQQQCQDADEAVNLHGSPSFRFQHSTNAGQQGVMFATPCVCFVGKSPGAWYGFGAAFTARAWGPAR